MLLRYITCTTRTFIKAYIFCLKWYVWNRNSLYTGSQKQIPCITFFGPHLLNNILTHLCPTEQNEIKIYRVAISKLKDFGARQ